MSNKQVEAKQALEQYLTHREFFKALCFSYEAKKRGAGRLYLNPDGRGGWEWGVVDTNPLSLSIPAISEEEYQLLKSKVNLIPGAQQTKPGSFPFLARIQSEVLQAWERVAFMTDYPERPFNNPDAVI